jgi:flagellin
LATGCKINKAADDAAGLAIAQTFKTQSSGTLIAEENAQHGVNLLQTADGDLGTIQENLQRVRDLVLQASSDTYSASERAMIASEVNARVEEITRVANASKFSNISLLNGSSSNITLQVGANSGADSQLNIGGALIKSTATALNANFTSSAITTALSSASGANAFIANVDSAISKVSTARSSIGTYQNRLSSTLDSLSVRYENMSSSLSTIQDTDIASETANLTKAQILQQISTSLLSTANQNPSIVLNLL